MRLCRFIRRCSPVACVMAMAVAVAVAVPGPLLAQPQAPDWLARWNAPADRHDLPIKVLALAGGGSVLLARSGLAPPSIEQRLALLRHGDDGAPLWTQVDPLLDSAEHIEPDLALAGTDAAVVAGYSGTTVIVRRLRLVDGGTIWQRERPLPPLSGRRPLRLAIDSASGQVLVAVADQGQLRVLRWQGDGEAVPDLHLAVPGFDLAPGAVVAGPDGEVTVAAREQEQSLGFGNSHTLVVGFAADGGVRFQQREGGPPGNQFGLPWVVADAQGTVTALAGSESSCGVPQAMLWRVDRAGQRQWLTHWPTSPCQGTTPVGLEVLPDGAVFVIHSVGGSGSAMAANRYHANGALAWSRKWAGSASALGASAFGGAVTASGQVAAVGSESLPPVSGTQPINRLAMVNWTADGGLCSHGRIDQGPWATRASSTDAGWLVAGQGAGLPPGSAAPDVLLLHYAAPTVCIADPLFSDGFQSF